MSQFTLSQLSAFNAVAKYKTFSKAATSLKKDRKTISEQVEYLEITLGYDLFERNGRSLELTNKGEQLYRRAQLLSADVSAFERYASSLFESDVKRLSVCFDESIPSPWLSSLNKVCHQKGITLSLLRVSRDHGEYLIKQDQCQFGLFLAKGQIINPDLYWKSLPPIAVSPFSSNSSELVKSQNCSIRALSALKQRVYTSATEPTEKYPLLVADNHVLVNELDILIEGLLLEPSWAFLPNHLEAKLPNEIVKLSLDIAEDDSTIQLQPVLLWAFEQPYYKKLILSAID
ncbi:LysR family transcriptional regulator [Vibrio sp. SCSIO 43140]|uniref:LysR family transcriptional regulator n=1 Tax=Vibrio sp. SCSIO 43140 TaxID=2819100 RepID=UPI0020750A38|nr:LysR family transcriptional regulator [Vibrio sp. SCSIO 43140]USD61961.1 LysR family transcriptional regulator [Vibrio sp. SCSIO 43140]